jgi:hypothetical protein
MNAPTRSLGEILGNLPATKSRRTGQPVWRNSYYVGQIEHRIWRPLNRGDRRGSKRWIGAMLQCAREFERRTRRARQQQNPGVRNGAIGEIGLAVLEVLYNRFVDYKTGRLDPAITTIAEAVGHSYAAVHTALRRLRDAGFLHWFRRSEPIQDAEAAGPQVRQVSNAYVPWMLPPIIERMVRNRLGKAPTPDDAEWAAEQRAKEWQAMLDEMSSAEFHATTWTGDKLAGETLARIAALLDKERESSRTVETGGI